MKSIRLTVAQAVIKYLNEQYVEKDWYRKQILQVVLVY